MGQHPVFDQRQHRHCRGWRSWVGRGITFAGQQQQGVHGLLHQARGGVQRQQLLLHGGRQTGVALKALDAHAQHGQRCAQFVTGVARERLFAVDESAGAVQQCVEGTGHGAHFVVAGAL